MLNELHSMASARTSPLLLGADIFPILLPDDAFPVLLPDPRLRDGSFGDMVQRSHRFPASSKGLEEGV